MHKKALGYLKDHTDFREMVFAVAMEYPEEFCKVMAKISGEEQLAWEDAMRNDVIAMAKQGEGKIQAIKYVRSLTQWGLKEAKDWCDALGHTHGLWMPSHAN